MHPCQGCSKWHRLVLHGLSFPAWTLPGGYKGFFHVLADCLLLVFFGLPLDFQRKFVAQVQFFLFLFRLCLCDLAWLIFHATALRKYQSTSSTVKISPTSTYATILWEQVEQGVLTLFAGLQRIIFLLHLASLTYGYRNEVLPVLLGMVKRLIFRKLSQVRGLEAELGSTDRNKLPTTCSIHELPSTDSVLTLIWDKPCGMTCHLYGQDAIVI